MKPQLSKWLVAPSPSRAQQPARADHGALPIRPSDEIQRDRLRAGDLEVEFQMVLQVLADAGQVGAPRGCRAPAARSAGPMPESFSSCGELIGPPDRITSRRAMRLRAPPALQIAHARRRACPRTGSRVASACVRTSRFGRLIAGLR